MSLSLNSLLAYGHFLPFIMIALAIIFLMLAKIMRLGMTTSLIAVVFFLACACLFEQEGDNAGLLLDNISRLGIKIIMPAVMIISFMIAKKSLDPQRKVESLLLVMISALGAMLTLASYNWMLLFMGIQCMSLPLYGLIAFDMDKKSLSSSIRYLLLSFVAMAIMLFGILLLYAATGTMDIALQAHKIAEGRHLNGLIGLSSMLIFVGLAFKVSLFPFHAWAPEVYEGSRLFVQSYLLVVVKSVVVIFIMRIAFIFSNAGSSLSGIITFMALFSMWVGFGLMLRQQSFIRLLAFLSIGHLGALMIPILAQNQWAKDAIFIDIIAFGMAILLIFASLKGLKDEFGNIAIKDLEGLYYKRPWASIALAISLISITGFPLTVGFVGKLAIFQAGFFASMWLLTINFVLSSILAMAVIAQVIAKLWQKNDAVLLKNPPKFSPILCGACIIILALGLFPETLVAFVKSYMGAIP